MWTLLTSKQLSNHQQGRQWRKQNCNVKSRAFARFTSLSAGFKQQPLAIFNKLRRWFSYNSRHTTGSALSWFHCQTMQHFSCGDTSTSTFRDDSSSFKLLWISCEIMGRAKVNRSKKRAKKTWFFIALLGHHVMPFSDNKWQCFLRNKFLIKTDRQRKSKIINCYL